MEKSGKITKIMESLEKSHRIPEKSLKFYLLFSVIFKLTVVHLLKWKFSVKTKHLKKHWKGMCRFRKVTVVVVLNVIFLQREKNGSLCELPKLSSRPFSSHDM